MIKFDLICANNHEFEGWFASNEDYSRQQDGNLLACPICENVKVSKALMAPRVHTSKLTVSAPKQDIVPMAASAPKEVVEQLRKLRKEIEKSADNVGDRFVEEARKIHYGESEKRGIYGKASREDAHSLQDEGIEVFPLPVLPEDKN